MPVPTTSTYSITALVQAHTSFKNLLDAGFAAGSIKIRDASDVLLVQIPLTRPCGTVDGLTGQLVLTPDGLHDAVATGIAAYGEFCDGDDAVHLSLPAQAGSSAAIGKLVISSLDIEAEGPVELVSATVG